MNKPNLAKARLRFLELDVVRPEWIAGDTADAYADRVLQWLEAWIEIWRHLYPDEPERGLRDFAKTALWHLDAIEKHQPGEDRK